MGKQHKRNKPAGVNRGPGEGGVLSKARQLLEAGKFRDAIDSYKIAAKQDPSGDWQSGLTEAYRGRFAQFLAKGMLENAGQILQNLKQLLPPEDWSPLQAQLLSLGSAVKGVADTAWDILLDTSVDLSARRSVAEGLAVAAKPAPPERANEPEVVAVLAVRAALRAVCSGDEGSLAEALRSIPRQSLLGPWKLLLRALDAWYRGDDATARENLQRLRDCGDLCLDIATTLKWLLNGAPPQSAPACGHSLALSLCGLSEHKAAMDAVEQAVSDEDLPKAFKLLTSKYPEVNFACKGLGVWLGDWLMPHYHRDTFENDTDPPAAEALIDSEVARGKRGFHGYLRFLINSGDILEDSTLVQLLVELNKMLIAELKEVQRTDLVVFNLVVAEIFLLKHRDFWEDNFHEEDYEFLMNALDNFTALPCKYLPRIASSWLARLNFLALRDDSREMDAILSVLKTDFAKDAEAQKAAAEIAYQRGLQDHACVLIGQAIEANPSSRDLLRLWVRIHRRNIAHLYSKVKTRPEALRQLAEMRQRLLSGGDKPDFQLQERWLPLFETALKTLVAFKKSGQLAIEVPPGFTAMPTFTKAAISHLMVSLDMEGFSLSAKQKSTVCSVLTSTATVTFTHDELKLFWHYHAWLAETAPFASKDELFSWSSSCLALILQTVDSSSEDQITQHARLIRALYARLFSNVNVQGFIGYVLKRFGCVDHSNPMVRLLLMDMELRLTYQLSNRSFLKTQLRILLTLEAEARKRSDVEAIAFVKELRTTLLSHAGLDAENFAKLKPLALPSLKDNPIEIRKRKPKAKQKTAAKKVAKVSKPKQTVETSQPESRQLELPL